LKGSWSVGSLFYLANFFVDPYRFIESSGVFLRHLKGVPNPKKEEAEIIPNEPGQVMLPRDRALKKCPVDIFSEGPAGALEIYPRNGSLTKNHV
jgi:hypothetical protein